MTGNNEIEIFADVSLSQMEECWEQQANAVGTPEEMSQPAPIVHLEMYIIWVAVAN